MNAFNGEHAILSRGNIEPTASRPIAQFWPVEKLNGTTDQVINSSPERKAFKKALVATLRGETEGALSPYLFFDPPEFSNNLDADYKIDWGSQTNVPYGASGWDAHIAQSVNTSEKGPANDYSFPDGDKEVIEVAIKRGLFSNLPRRSTYYSYGPGEYTAISRKDFVILDEMIKQEFPLPEAINAVDINYRYARLFAEAANARYNKASSAVQGDFMEGTLDLGQKTGTAIIAIFGGPIANAAKDKNNTAKQNASRYLAKLVSQHGEGTRVLQTIETESRPSVLLKEYAATKRFEAFILGALPRAVHQGIILNPKYDVFKNWKLVTDFDEATRAVRLIAEAKKSHTLEIEKEPNQRKNITFGISKGDGFVFTLSHKWNQEDWREICDPAGLNDLTFYGDDSRKLMYSKAIREPDPALLI